MVTIEYKILFEVRLFHDYYLADSLGNSFFSLDQNWQTTRLQEKLRKDRYDILTDFEILISKSDQLFLRNHRMKLVRTKLGFFVGIEVDSEKSGGGKIIYKPVIPPSQDAELKIGLGLKNQYFLNFSNLPLVFNEENILYFSNLGDKNNNILSQPIAKLVEGQVYNMGDLCTIDNIVCKAINKNNGEIEPWQRIEGDGFVHQADLFPIRKDPWFLDWLLDLGTSGKSPFAILRLNSRSENQQLSPIKENGYLTTEFLPSQTRPRHPVFELRFLGRSTYWRYKKSEGFSPDETDIINSHAEDLLTNENGNFVTKTPYFFAAEMPYLDSNGFRLPSAKPNSIKFENEKVYSDIFFNDINPIHDVI